VGLRKRKKVIGIMEGWASRRERVMVDWSGRGGEGNKMGKK
jgi:hypothetical protein